MPTLRFEKKLSAGSDVNTPLFVNGARNLAVALVVLIVPPALLVTGPKKVVVLLVTLILPPELFVTGPSTLVAESAKLTVPVFVSPPLRNVPFPRMLPVLSIGWLLLSKAPPESAIVPPLLASPWE